VKDDPESIRLRQEHVRWMREMGEADDLLTELETIASAQPVFFVRLLLRIARWIYADMSEQAEEAREAARGAYEDRAAPGKET
jgi:hypothetical protein